MTMDDGGVSRNPLTFQVTERLRRDILLGVIPSGSRITVQTIAERYNTSAIPVRETLRTLHGENLIIMQPYKGAVVRTVDLKFIEGMYDILRSMEVLMIENVAGHWDQELRSQVLEANCQLATLDEDDIQQSFNRLNRAFHDPLEQFCENERARELRDYYHMCISILTEDAQPHTMERLACVVAEHQAIMDALDDGDMDSIRKAYMAHALSAKKEFLRQIHLEK